MKRLRGTKLAVKEKHIEEWLRMKERIVLIHLIGQLNLHFRKSILSFDLCSDACFNVNVAITLTVCSFNLAHLNEPHDIVQ
jgi:hypothetical protein